jgi:hypothetical protein
MNRETAEAIILSQREEIEALLTSKAPSRSGSSNRALIFCTGGSLAAEHLSLWRGVTDGANFHYYLPTKEHFPATSVLHHRVYEIHCSLWLDRPNRGHLYDVYRKQSGNAKRAPKASVTPRVDKGPFPIDEVEKTNIFIIGSVVDFYTAFKADGGKTELSQLMLRWARLIIDMMKKLKDAFKTDVFFLGSGVAANHPKFGLEIHVFNAEMLKLVKEDGVKQVSEYPRLYFHDLYSPIGLTVKEQEWLLFSKTASTKVELTWSEESDVWMSKFHPMVIRYLEHQCVSSADRRYEAKRAAEQQVATKSAFARKTPASPKKKVPKSPKKAAAPKREERARSTTPKLRGKATFE